MQFTTHSDIMKDIVKQVAGFMDNKPNLPVLACVRIRVEGSKVTVYGTNQHHSITYYVPAPPKSISGEGDIVVTAQSLNKILSLYKVNQELTFSVVNNTFDMQITGLDDTITLKGLDPDEMPRTPSIDDMQVQFTITGKELAQAITRTVFCTASNDNRPVLENIYMEYDENSITFASADGYRLAMHELPVDTDNFVCSPYTNNTLLHNETAKALLKVLDNDKIYTVSLCKVDNVEDDDIDMLVIQADNISVTSVVAEGRYPDFRAIVPTSQVDTRMSVTDYKTFLNVLKRAAVFADYTANMVSISADDTTCTLTADGAELGLYENDLSSITETTCTKNTNVGCNVRYLIDIIKTCKDNVIIELRAHNGDELGRPPIVVKKGFTTYLIMPMGKAKG